MMPDYSNFNVLLDPFLKIMLYLGRAAVQRQLITIAVILVAAGFISQAIGVGIKRFVVPRIERSLAGRLQAFLKHGLLIITDIAFPMMSLYATDYVRNQFIAEGELYGLLNNLYFLLWILFIYRLCISLFYQIFGKKAIRGYHYRILGPLFALYVFAYILLDLVDIYQVYNLELLKFSESDTPLTLGALFLSTIGLYFWINLVLGVENFIQHLGKRYTAIPPGTIEAVLTPIRYILILTGVVMAFTNLGLNENTIAAITGGLSVGIGFGLQEVLTNFISGILLLFEQSLRPGDVISIDGEIGEVKKMSIRSTTIQTLNNVELIVPNQTFFTSTVTTYTQSSKVVRILIPMEVSEDTAKPEFMDYLLDLANKHPLIESEPEPSVLATGFGDSSVTYNIAVWVHDPLNIEQIMSDMNKVIWAGYDEHGFANSTPERNLNVLSVPTT
ncbi:mechanosensitive ion channel [Anaerolineales bacterium HSG24]|nr:mechanosensitive ion channel [Anaerolineales bacterium HSG24]